jgi:predicted nuclease of predicted toxin-antitoxin system
LKFLLDENISRRIIPLIRNEFPDVLDLFSYTSQSKLPISDHTVWRLAKENAAHIITRDDDFLKLSMLFGFPPKVICLQVGNVRNTILAEILLANAEKIRQFVENQDLGFLILKKAG